MMIVVALVLTSLGTADIVRSYIAGRSGALIAIVAGLALMIAYGSMTGIDWWWLAITGLLLTCWTLFARSERSPAMVWLIAAPLAVMVAALAFPPSRATDGSPIAQWYDSLQYSALEALSFESFAVAVGSVIFLVETSNVMVRLVLNAAKSDGRPSAAASNARSTGGRRWRVLLPWRSSVDIVAEELPQVAYASALRGGRIIGPLERVFIFALALAGEFTAIGAVVAAKGIVRFPEISKNGSDGSKAEEFLIGSFSSWALVVVATILVKLGAAV